MFLSNAAWFISTARNTPRQVNFVVPYPGRVILPDGIYFFPGAAAGSLFFFVLCIYCIYNSRNFYRSLGRLFLNYLSFKESGFPLARQHLLSETTPCAGSALHCFSSQKLGELCTHLIVRKTDDNM